MYLCVDCFVGKTVFSQVWFIVLKQDNSVVLLVEKEDCVVRLTDAL